MLSTYTNKLYMFTTYIMILGSDIIALPPHNLFLNYVRNIITANWISKLCHEIILW